jgi:hypothetical protein
LTRAIPTSFLLRWLLVAAVCAGVPVARAARVPAGQDALRADASPDFLTPSFGVSLLQVTTSDFNASPRPLVQAGLGLTLDRVHTVGVEIAATTDFFTSPSNNDRLFYSNVAFYYRYRFVGGPIRAPIFPVVPTYGAIRIKPMPIPDSVYGPKFDMDVGGRLYFATLHGPGATSLDSELARDYQGVELTLTFDRRISDFRLRGELAGGYTVIRGQLVTGAIGFGLTYDQWTQVSPGFQVRYAFINGDASPDSGTPGAGTLSIGNQLLSAGAVLYFKL